MDPLTTVICYFIAGLYISSTAGYQMLNSMEEGDQVNTLAFIVALLIHTALWPVTVYTAFSRED